MEQRIVLSVVVPTRHAWPGVRAQLDALLPQVERCGGELVVVDGDGAAFSGEPPARVRWLRHPGRSVYALRAIGLVEARGDVIAITEDHCLAAPDFCEAVVRAHAERDDDVVAGAIVNGATAHAIDRASFLLVHGPNRPPLRARPHPWWIPSLANISYKRAALPDSEPPSGWLETSFNPTAVAEGRVGFDDRVRVAHVQSIGRVGTFVNWYRAGRSMTGLLRELIPPGPDRRRFFAAGVLALGPHSLRAAWVTACRHPGGRQEFLRYLPLLVGLTAAGVVGYAAGALAGPGTSAHKIH